MRGRFVAVCAVALVLASCASGAAKPPSTVSAELKEFLITLGSTEAAAGSVTFNLKNAGTIPHEFVVVKTNLAANALPVESGVVPETGLDVIGEQEDIEVGATPTLVLTLPAGHYVVLCNLEGHYAAGMHADLTTR
jgi:uncharacterized cupredoxin-like copper-binding protein